MKTTGNHGNPTIVGVDAFDKFWDAGCHGHRANHLGEDRLRHAAQSGHARPQALLEIDAAVHGFGSDRGHSGAGAGSVSEELDNLIFDEG